MNQQFIDEEIDLIDNYLNKKDWRVNENSNMQYSLQGINYHLASTLTAKYWLKKIYPLKIRKAHRENFINIHDLGVLSSYCVGWNLEDLLINGFTGVSGKMSSGPAKHFRSVLGQIVNFFYTLQGESAGAQAFSNFDTYLAPFIYYDNLSYNEVKQALQEFLFNMNVPTRAGGQCPFTNVTLDLKIPEHFENKQVIHAGEIKPIRYIKFQYEMDLFNKAFCECMLEGDADGRLFSFPIPTINITKNFDWENKNLNTFWKMTSRYGVPYFSNYINSDMKPEDATSMCPLAGTEKVLIKSSRYYRPELCQLNTLEENKIYEVYANGKYKKGKFKKYKNQQLFEIELINGHKIKTTGTHINRILYDGQETDKTTFNLLNNYKNTYLPYFIGGINGDGGDEELGYLIGAFAGDGSFDDNTVVFSLSFGKKEAVKDRLIKICKKYFGASYSIKKYNNSKLLTLRIYSKAVKGYIQEFVVDKEREKTYTPKIIDLSKNFREGVLNGHYTTDGGNRHRIYTSSIKMVEMLNLLVNSLGKVTSVNIDKRKGRLSENICYVVRIYQLKNKKYKDIYKIIKDKAWFKIKKIKKIKGDTGYCFEIDNKEEPLFVVANTGILTHNCRLRIDHTELQKRGGGLFGANPLTGSIGVVTINLPKLAYLSKDEKEFFNSLAHYMDIAKDSLEIKREYIETFTQQGLYPYVKFYLRDVYKKYNEYWYNHFSTIGLVGMNEACLNLFNKNILDKKGKEFAEKVLDFMRNKIFEYQKETDNFYNLEATPAESTSYKFAKKDKDDFLDIITSGSDEPYYTNSVHPPVGFTDDIFELLDHQDTLQTKFTGGTVVHLFLGEKIDDHNICKKLVKNICENYGLPYFSITPTFSICPVCGYLSGEHKFCPNNHSEENLQKYGIEI